MRIRVAISFANIYMGIFEDDHVYTYHLKPSINLWYLEDTFLIWQHGLEKLHTFVDSRSDSMKFTMEHSREQHLPWYNYLLFCKPTDSHSYLVYNCTHPNHCKKSIPHSQFRQIRRICSNLTDFDKHLQKNEQTEMIFWPPQTPERKIKQPIIKPSWWLCFTLLTKRNLQYLLQLGLIKQKPQYHISTPEGSHTVDQKTYVAS